MAADLSIEKLPPEAWPAVMGLCARAFFDEPFVHELFGPDPVVRFAGIHALYASGTPDEQDVWLGAFAGTALVGLVRSSPSGRCHVCAHGGVGTRPAGVVEGLDWDFEAHVRRAHSSQGEHGWVSRLAVEPALHGQGIGRRVMAAAVAGLDADGATAVLLECQGHRVEFYESCGFQVVGTFPDPAGPDAYLMRSDR